MTRALSYLMLLSLAVMWSSSFTVIKVGVETVSPVLMTALRIVMAAALLWGYMRLRGTRLPAWGPVWISLFALGAFGNSLPFMLISWGETEIDSGLTAILMAFMPISTIVLLHFFTSDEKINPMRALGIAFGLAGVVVLIGVDALQGLGAAVWAQVSVASGGICYAIANTWARRLPPLTPEAKAAGSMICASLQMVPLAFWLEDPLAWQPDMTGTLSVIYLGLVPTALAAIILFKLIDLRGATFLALVNYLIPAMGVLWGVLFLSEVASPRQLIALALILCGVAIIGRAQMRFKART